MFGIIMLVFVAIIVAQIFSRKEKTNNINSHNYLPIQGEIGDSSQASIFDGGNDCGSSFDSGGSCGGE
ncbi:hypothetical protein C2I17_01385 [Niallia circulans]|uniref:hypothetical protein n=1 Tax=Niallia circulans TaxID=1397 RepID=UPI00201D2EBF|nr:hypothetical protein [Niallia circulans]UQZ73317.1 hypothetical protein C2I17_01385 [Niallia circulans]